VTSLADCCDDYSRAEVHCAGDVGVQALISSSVRASCGRALECGVYAVATGVELRTGYSPDDIVRTQLLPTLEAARALAAAWRQALIEKGFEERPTL